MNDLNQERSLPSFLLFHHGTLGNRGVEQVTATSLFSILPIHITLLRSLHSHFLQPSPYSHCFAVFAVFTIIHHATPD